MYASNEAKKNTCGIITFIFSLCLCMGFLLVGCSPKETTPQAPLPTVEKEEETPAYISPFIAVTSPKRLPYLIQNKLDIHYIYPLGEEEGGENYLSISGLQDKDTEALINEKIKAFYEDLKSRPVPPYRGIKRVLDETRPMKSQSTMLNLTFNFNNLLCISGYESRIYPKIDSYDELYVDIQDALTIDLSSGEEVALSDLFADDASYLEILSDKTKTLLEKEFSSDEYSEWFHSTQLIAPFKGIREGSTFALSDGGMLLLYLNHETPEFDTGFSTHYMMVPFLEIQDALALYDRFYKGKENLYIDPAAPTIMLLSSYNKHLKGESYYQEEEGSSIYIQYRYPEDLPPKAIDAYKTLLNLEENKKMDKTRKMLYLEGYASIIGHYISCGIHVSKNYGQYSEFKTLFMTMDQEGNEVPLEDLFEEGYDVSALLRAKLHDVLAIDFPSVVLEEEVLNEYIDTLTYRINPMGLYFSTKPMDINEQERYSIQFSIDFHEIGIDHLPFIQQP